MPEVTPFLETVRIKRELLMQQVIHAVATFDRLQQTAEMHQAKVTAIQERLSKLGLLKG
jgi:hypothetical protein